MNTSPSSSENTLRQIFRQMNKFMLFMWRLGLGSWMNSWPSVGGRIMVITHTGRKTGIQRQTPVNYATVDGEVYCVAGFGSGSDWYRNMQANPNIEVWLPDSWWAGVAEFIDDDPRRLAILREILIASGFAARAAGINPHTLSDEELARVTANYPLIHIRRAEARTGPGGPGDLSWVWPLATLILLPLVFLRRRPRRCC